VRRAVADASFCGAWILPDEASPAAEALLRDLQERAVELVVPSLWIFEMGNLLRSSIRRGRLSETLAIEAFALLRSTPVTYSEAGPGSDAEAMLRLALRHDLSFYDAAYLELALRLNAPLLTADRKLKQAFESTISAT